MRNKLAVTLEFGYVEYRLLLFQRFNDSLLEDTYCINYKVFRRVWTRPKKLAWGLVVVVWKSLCFYLSMFCLCCSDPQGSFLTSQIVLYCHVWVSCCIFIFVFCKQYRVSDLFVFSASLCSYSSIFMWFNKILG